MPIDEARQRPTTRWSSVQAYQLAAGSLALGLVLGFLIRGRVVTQPGSASAKPPATIGGTPAATHVPIAPGARPGLPPQNPPEVAAEAARDVLDKLKTDPNNFDLLVQAGNIYLHSRVFGGAVAYYQKALQVKDDATVRNDYANALYYAGDPDGALRQYEAVLKADPKNANALFNRGMVRWRGKQDPQGAVESWKLLLKLNPMTPRRAYIEDLIARASKDAARQPE